MHSLSMPKRNKRKSKKGRNKDGTFKKGHKLSRTKRNRKNPKRAPKKKRRRARSHEKVSRLSVRSPHSLSQLRRNIAEDVATATSTAYELPERYREARELERNLAQSRYIPRNPFLEPQSPYDIQEPAPADIEPPSTAPRSGFRDFVRHFEEKVADEILGDVADYIRNNTTPNRRGRRKNSIKIEL